jgi:hypothetical protein
LTYIIQDIDIIQNEINEHFVLVFEMPVMNI